MRVNIHNVKFDKSNIAKGIAALVFCLVTFGSGYWVAQHELETREKLRGELINRDPRKRVAALKKVAKGEFHPPTPMLMRRMTDEHHFVSGTAAETIYRMGLGKKLTSVVVANLMERLPKEPEFTKRWLIANIVVVDYEAGFELAAQHLPKMNSRWSKPFFVRILTLHAEKDGNAQKVLTEMLQRDERYSDLAKLVQAKLAMPEKRRWRSNTDFLPPTLLVKKVPPLATDL